MATQIQYTAPEMHSVIFLLYANEVLELHVFPPMRPPTDSFFEGVLRPATLESGVRQTSVGTSDI